MIRRPRTILAAALVLAFGTSAIALGDAANQESTVTGSVEPQKLKKKEFKKVALTTGVTTESVNGGPFIPSAPSEEVYIDFDDDIKINLSSVPECTAVLTGTTSVQAQGLCPDSIVNTGGDAAARVPTQAGPQEFTDFTVTAFHGPGNDLRLHAYSPSLTSANTQVVEGEIVNSPNSVGNDFGKRLAVADVPDAAGDQGALVRFFATIERGRVVTARCKDGNRKLNFRGEFHYESADALDTDTDVVTDTFKCKR